MRNKDFAEQEETSESRRIWIKKLNKFLSDYFRWLVVAIVAVVLASSYFLLLKPKYDQTMNHLNLANRQEQADFNAKNEELKKVKALLDAYAGIDPNYLDKVKAIAPAVQNKEELFSEINYLVSRNQLFLQSVSLSEVGGYGGSNLVAETPADKEIAGKIRSVTVSLSVAGADYQGLKNFLAALENNLRLMDVTSLSFSPGGGSTILSFITYYVKE